MQGEIKWDDYFYYDETSPSCLRWKVDITTGEFYKRVLVKVGESLYSKSDEGYYVVKLHNRTYQVHRIVYELFYGSIPDGFIIDHINRNKEDNRVSNIRLTTTEYNARNRSKHCNNSTGVTGVYFRESKHSYYVAFWYDINGKMRQKYFSVLKHGKDEAFDLAIRWRKLQIDQLNSLGHGYTDKHGE